MIAVDLFAGMGGFTEGATQAGIRVAMAANHWPAAVAVHALNHPQVEHMTQDLQQADFHQWPSHDFLLASPSCQGHSNARGKDKPRHDAARATAWAVVTCAEVHRPAVVVAENVREWSKWVLWPAWWLAMESLGYAVSPHVLNAADYGVPQDRERLIVICTRSKAPLVLRERRGSYRPATDVIDWDSGTWGEIGPHLSERAQVRIAHGRKHHGERFTHSYYGSEKHSRSISLPVRTLTTKDRHAVVDGKRQRMLTADECRKAMGFPATYKLPASSTLAKHMLGNAVAPPMVAGVLSEILEAA